MVHEFHSTFKHPVENNPSIDKDNENQFRISLIQEELDELKEALDARDEVEVLDALCDLQYVLDGAFIALGFHVFKEDALEEVHRSNMSKLFEDGPRYNEKGKVIKGPNFSLPDLKSVLTKA